LRSSRRSHSSPSAASRSPPSFPTRRSSDLLDAALDRGGAITSETIGPLSFSYAESAASSRTFPLVEKLIDPFRVAGSGQGSLVLDRKSTRLNSSHVKISYAVFCLKKKTYDI